MTMPNITLSMDRPLTKDEAEWMAHAENLINDFADSPEFLTLMENGFRDMMVYGTATFKAEDIDGAIKAWHVKHTEVFKK